MLIRLTRFSNECRTYLVHHVDKGLDIVPTEATDQAAFALTGKDRLDQGRKFAQDERVSDQTLTGWGIRVGEEGRIEERSAFSTRLAQARLRTHYSRLQKQWQYHQRSRGWHH